MTSVTAHASITAAAVTSVRVRVGFNHRFHPALQKARQVYESGVLGPLMFIRGRYGHGGRIGYDREWRADPKLSGGGELIDQGVHLIDLAGWFLGAFTHIDGHAATYFWKMPVDDNAFLNLRTAGGQTAWLSQAKQVAQDNPSIKALVYFDSDDKTKGPRAQLALKGDAVSAFGSLLAEPYFNPRRLPSSK
jgi:predicted dehydrogenase